MAAARLEQFFPPDVPETGPGPSGRLWNRRKGDLRPADGHHGIGWPMRVRFEDQFTNPRHEPYGPSYDDEDEDAGNRRLRH